MMKVVGLINIDLGISKKTFVIQNNKENTQIVELKFRAVIKITEKDPDTSKK